MAAGTVGCIRTLILQHCTVQQLLQLTSQRLADCRCWSIATNHIDLLIALISSIHCIQIDNIDRAAELGLLGRLLHAVDQYFCGSVLANTVPLILLLGLLLLVVKCRR